MTHRTYSNTGIKGYPDSWYAASTVIPDAAPSLSDALDVDVCVIGAGYTGLSSAIHLAKSGKKVAIIEAERAGWGASGRMVGMSAPVSVSIKRSSKSS